MNNARRNEIKEAITSITNIRDVIQQIEYDEEESFANMPEGLQVSWNGERSEHAQDQLQEAVEKLDDVIDILEDSMF